MAQIIAGQGVGGTGQVSNLDKALKIKYWKSITRAFREDVAILKYFQNSRFRHMLGGQKIVVPILDKFHGGFMGIRDGDSLSDPAHVNPVNAEYGYRHYAMKLRITDQALEVIHSGEDGWEPLLEMQLRLAVTGATRRLGADTWMSGFTDEGTESKKGTKLHSGVLGVVDTVTTAGAAKKIKLRAPGLFYGGDGSSTTAKAVTTNGARYVWEGMNIAVVDHLGTTMRTFATGIGTTSVSSKDTDGSTINCATLAADAAAGMTIESGDLLLIAKAAEKASPYSVNDTSFDKALTGLNALIDDTGIYGTINSDTTKSHQAYVKRGATKGTLEPLTIPRLVSFLSGRHERRLSIPKMGWGHETTWEVLQALVSKDVVWAQSADQTIGPGKGVKMAMLGAQITFEIDPDAPYFGVWFPDPDQISLGELMKMHWKERAGSILHHISDTTANEAILEGSWELFTPDRSMHSALLDVETATPNVFIEAAA